MLWQSHAMPNCGLGRDYLLTSSSPGLPTIPARRRAGCHRNLGFTLPLFFWSPPRAHDTVLFGLVEALLQGSKFRLSCLLSCLCVLARSSSPPSVFASFLQLVLLHSYPMLYDPRNVLRQLPQSKAFHCIRLRRQPEDTT